MTSTAPTPAMRRFDRVYYGVAALTLAATACLPWLVPLSYRALGFAPELEGSGTFAAFQAHLATLALRRRFIAALLLLALALAALSLAGAVLRARRATTLRWPLLVLTAVGAAGVVLVAIGGLLAGMCC